MSAVASLVIPLLVQVGADAAVAEAYKADPEAVMAQFKLTESAKEAMRNGAYGTLKSIDDIKMTDSVIKAYK